MPSHVDFIFWSFFDGLLLPTSTPGTSRIKPPLQREHDLSKNRFSQFVSIFLWFWCQHAFMFLPKIQWKCIKIATWKASFFWLIFASFFYRFWLDFGSQLGAMLATFSLKMGGPCGMLPSFWLGLCYFSIWGPSWPPLGAIWPRFWRVWGSILQVFGAHALIFIIKFCELKFSIRLT